MSDESMRQGASEPQVQESFYFDEFFADDDDPGVTVPVKIRGKMVPITFKRGLTVEDKAKAQTEAIKVTVSPDGRPVFGGIDSAKASVALLAVSIKAWPFTFRDGRPVPVTPENIKKMLGGGDEMAEVIKKLEEEGAEALVPFVGQSTED